MIVAPVHDNLVMPIPRDLPFVVYNLSMMNTWVYICKETKLVLNRSPCSNFTVEGLLEHDEH